MLNQSDNYNNKSDDNNKRIDLKMKNVSSFYFSSPRELLSTISVRALHVVDMGNRLIR